MGHPGHCFEDALEGVFGGKDEARRELGERGSRVHQRGRVREEYAVAEQIDEGLAYGRGVAAEAALRRGDGICHAPAKPFPVLEEPPCAVAQQIARPEDALRVRGQRLHVSGPSVAASPRSTASPSANERKCTRFRRPPRSRFTSGTRSEAPM